MTAASAPAWAPALASAPTAPGWLALEVCVSAGPRRVLCQTLELPAGSCVAAALTGLQASVQASPAHAAEWLAALAALPQPWRVGIWGKKALPDQVLKQGDRLEIYRPLKVDPKVARRARFVRQGAKTAGLFAQRRQGAKAGY